jgi:hypothetical protein
MYKMKKLTKLIFIIVLLQLTCSCSKKERVLPIEGRTLSVDEYRSKMKAGWLGQMVGVGWGGPTEFKWKGEIIPADGVPQWQPEMVNQFNQDDIYVEMTFLRTLELHGFDVSIRQAGIDFANSKYGLAHSNLAARVNLRNGIAPPDAGHPKFNRHVDDIDYQIEADFSGLISPGMPNEAIRLGEVFGRLMNYGDGLYGGQFVGGMYAEAFFEKDVHKIVEAGLACVPKGSQFHECISNVIEWHRQNPNDWQKTWELINEKYHLNPDYRKASCLKGSFNIDAKINAAYIVMGLLYGEGDIDKTIVISMRCGSDSDCNPSNAAGILFTAKGYSNIPERFTSALDPESKFSHTPYNYDLLTAVCEKLARQAVIKSGGRVEKGASGEEVFVIPVQKAKPSKLEQSWEPGPIANSRYTPEELDQMDLDIKLTESENGPDDVMYRYGVDFQEDEFMRKWLVLGPMPYVGREDVHIDSDIDGIPMTREEIKQVFDLNSIDVVNFQPKVTIDGKEYEWAIMTAKHDVINLTDLVKNDADYKVAYLWAQIDMPMDRRYLLGIGHENGVKVWLNGELVHENWSDWRVVVDDDRFWVNLKKGKNQIVMKIQSGESPMGFCFRLLDW